MKISQAAFEAIRAHGAEGYPNEICGIMVGPSEGGFATEAKRARNTVVDRPHDRYDIDTRDLIRIHKEAHNSGLDVVGYYHSHPDHPAAPSIIDTEKASSWYVYVIVSVERGRPVATNGFVLEEATEKKKFRPEPLEVV
jgi:proteasome lid subunit RPN8/RPN11